MHGVAKVTELDKGRFPLEAGMTEELLDSGTVPSSSLMQRTESLILGLVFHLVQIGVPVDRLDGPEGSDLATPYAGDNETQRGKNADDPEQYFLHGRVIYSTNPVASFQDTMDL